MNILYILKFTCHFDISWFYKRGMFHRHPLKKLLIKIILYLLFKNFFSFNYLSYYLLLILKPHIILFFLTQNFSY
jgi:hypothetical protein